MDMHSKLLEKLVETHHVYRRILKAIDLDKLLRPLESLYSDTGTPGEPVMRGFKCLLLQHWENLSDRQLERYLKDSLAAKWFCRFGLEDSTPDHSYFGKLRKRIGVERLAELFNSVVQALTDSGHVGNVFHFVDASQVLSKINLWEARDKAIADRENQERNDDGAPKMNNSNVSKYCADPDARFGCKGKKNFWFGYKKHLRVDMREGMITKVAVTPANTPDGRAFLEEKLCPDQGMVFLDKAYDSETVYLEINSKGCASGIIKRNNRKDKNRALDRWRSSVRMPFEGTFSKLPKRTRYRGKPKVLFQQYFQALVHNFKRLIVIEQRVAA